MVKIDGISKIKSKARWEVLLSNTRERSRTTKPHELDKRNTFDNDYSRLISSAPIRRLQDKTQVFPLEKSDFIRTRLTHSHEVAAIARSIGKSIEKILIEKGYLDKSKDSEISSLLLCAGLIHDLGNPPFGHFGEEAIQGFFKSFFDKIEADEVEIMSKDKTENYEILKKWDVQKKQDFIKFDGNVQTLRILSRLYYIGEECGYNLSFPTLSTIIKYPRNSVQGNKKELESDNVCDKKFGCFLSEEGLYHGIDKTLKLGGQRHPVTFLLEAADDISYASADIEDGIKMGILDFETVKEVFLQHVKNFTKEEKEIFTKFVDDYKKYKGIGKADSLDIAVQRLRINTQSHMINSIINTFFENYKEIMEGTYKYSLLEKSKAQNIKKVFKELFKQVCSNKSIIETELAGYKIIQGLLGEYIDACCETNFKKDGRGKNNRLYNTISSSYRYLYENKKNFQTKDELYNKFQLITDFISGMTDSYALEHYQRISGIKL